MPTPTPTSLKPQPRADGFIDNPNGKYAGDWGYNKNGTPFLPNGQVFAGLGGDNPNFILPNPIDVGNTVVAKTQEVGKFLGSLSNPYLWKRIGIGVMGGLFIWWGVLAFLATNKKVQGAVIGGAKQVLKKTPEGAVANLATDAIGS